MVAELNVVPVPAAAVFHSTKVFSALVGPGGLIYPLSSVSLVPGSKAVPPLASKVTVTFFLLLLLADAGVPLALTTPAVTETGPAVKALKSVVVL